MSLCCDTPHLTRLEKIKDNRSEKMQTNPMQTNPMPRENINNYWNPLPREDMTNVVIPTNDNMSGNENIMVPNPIPELPPIDGPVENFPGNPTFQVPANPLLPPGYSETLDYGSLQYMNGFYRTQIGRYVYVEQQTTSDIIERRYGYLIGVGYNYLLLQDSASSNVFAIDSYSIKLFYVYYNPEMPFSAF